MSGSVYNFPSGSTNRENETILFSALIEEAENGE